MNNQDFIFVPLYLLLIYSLAYKVRPKVTDKKTKKYFIPALTLKVIGSIALGIIYFYYYGYGDTLRYHHHSKIISNLFWEEPITSMRVLFVNLMDPAPDLLKYFQYNYFFHTKDEGTFLIFRITGFLGIFTNHSYFAIAILFASISFSGVWAMYLTFVKLYPHLYKNFAVACLFFPSLFFWGSGIMKDTITIGALGWLFYGIHKTFFVKKDLTTAIIIILLSSWLLIVIKIYIFLCFIPGILIWIFTAKLDKLKSKFMKSSLRPILIILVMPIGILILSKVAENDKRYALENLEKTAQTTAEWIHYSSGESGSAYSLGNDFDLSPVGLLKKLPLAINVTLFRPYLWEVNNAVMLLSALESLYLFILTILIIYRIGLLKFISEVNSNSFLLFLAVFSFSFAFAVGFSTYNFGTLVRYKIPCIPFYIALLYILNDIHNKRKQLRDSNKFKKHNIINFSSHL